MALRQLPPPHIPFTQGPEGKYQSTRGWREWLESLDKFVRSIGAGAEATLCIEFHGGGFALDANSQAWLRVPFDCEILSWTATAQPSGSVVVDLWRDAYGAFPPTNADSITASAPVTISSAVKATNSTLTGWNKDITAFDYILANIDSVTSVEDLLIEIQVKKT